MYLFPLLYGYRYIQAGGVLQTQRDTINFIGGTVVDNQAQGRTDVYLSSGSGGITALLGDVKATGPGSVTGTVAGIQSFPVSTTAPSLSTDVLRWQGSWYAPAAESGGGSTPTGTGFEHVTGGVQDAASSLGATKTVPMVNAGGTDIAWVAFSGDFTTTAAGVGTVAKINGASVPAAGALTTGNAPYVSGASALIYSALNLAGGSGWVTGLLPVANFAPGTAGQIFVSNATPNAVWTSLISYETTHGRFTSGGSESDFQAVIGPRVGAETTDACLWLQKQAIAPTTGNWCIGYGTGLDASFAPSAHTGSIYLQAPGIASGSHYGDVVICNANGNPGTTEVISWWDGASGTLIATYGVQVKNGANPSTPVGGPQLFGSAGAAKIIGTSGTVTTAGAASLGKSILDTEACPRCEGNGGYTRSFREVRTEGQKTVVHDGIAVVRCADCLGARVMPTKEEKHCPGCGGDFGWQWESPINVGAHPEMHEHFSQCAKCTAKAHHKRDELATAMLDIIERLAGSQPALRTLLEESKIDRAIIVEEVA